MPCCATSENVLLSTANSPLNVDLRVHFLSTQAALCRCSIDDPAHGSRHHPTIPIDHTFNPAVSCLELCETSARMRNLNSSAILKAQISNKPKRKQSLKLGQ